MLLGSTSGLEVTTCNCTKPQHKGFIQFQENGCQQTLLNLQAEKTTGHIIYSYEEGLIQFPGYICSMWYRQAEVTGGVIYGTKVVKYGRQAKETTPEECWKMKEFKLCGEQLMNAQSSDTWRWDAEPSQDVTWMGHVTNSELNCLLEEVTLEKPCENCAITTPFGSLSTAKHLGNFTQHHVTLVWKNTWQKDKPCALHRVNVAANGTLTHLSKGTFRLRNSVQQSDFLIKMRTDDSTGSTISTLCGKPTPSTTFSE